jgi:CubicO group peptidase (beta-lactamase class C family)
MRGMKHRPSRRDMVKTTVALAAAGALRARRADAATPNEPKTLAEIDATLHAATRAGELAGIVAMAATDSGVIYEGIFGTRRVPDGPAMTRDTVFGIASMVKLITSVAALQLVEQGKLALDAPVPDIDPALGSPQVLDGFDAKGVPQLRPAKRPIALRHLLTHTSGFAYRLWDAKVIEYSRSLERLPAARRKNLPRTPLMFDPGEAWQYGNSIDWVGRIVEAISGEPVEVYFRKHILDPLGMNDTAFVLSPPQYARQASNHRRGPSGGLIAEPLDPLPKRPHIPAPHTFSGGGGIYSTAPDYLTLLRALLAGGALNGTRILQPDTVALMGENQIGDVNVGVMKTTIPGLSNDVDFFPGIRLKWGFGGMVNMQPVPGARGAGSLTWAGLLNTYFWIDPTKRVAAVFMTQVLPFADTRALRLYRQFERGIYAALKT